ncbi:hypothetical protein DFJ77DRAFT_459784 [Powellomyces hirtus]|nr:hypothetical protein DFJ77DRAFT_459784 [Powellomyces hirtus]
MVLYRGSYRSSLRTILRLGGALLTVCLFVTCFLVITTTDTPRLRQSAKAALRNAVKDFQLPNEVQQSDIRPLRLMKNDSTKNENEGTTPLCLVATWGGGDLPVYADMFVESLARNAPHVSLHMFVHNDTIKPMKPISAEHAKLSNIHYVDLADIKPEYRETGWAGFTAERLCALYTEIPNPPLDGFFHDPSSWRNRTASPTKAQCEELYTTLKPYGTKIMIQMRGVYGQLFEEWIGPKKCSAWAWTDMDVVYGDLTHALSLTSTTMPWAADIVTLSAGDFFRHYVHGQFTAHMQWTTQKAFSVNRLWRRCDVLRNITNLIDELKVNRWNFALDEGCYAQAVLTAPGIHTAILPLQLATWGHHYLGYPSIYLLIGNTVLGCLKPDHECLDEFASLVAGAWSLPALPNASLLPFTTTRPYSNISHTAIRVKVNIDQRDCGLHYPEQDTVCLLLDWGTPAADALRAGRATSLVAVSSMPGNIQLQFHDPPGFTPYTTNLIPHVNKHHLPKLYPGIHTGDDHDGIIEVAQVHFQQWKEKLGEKNCVPWDRVFRRKPDAFGNLLVRNPKDLKVMVYGDRLVVDATKPC